MQNRNLNRARAMSMPDVFHFSAYWQTWSRVITPYEVFPVIELNLTPPNPQYHESWLYGVIPVKFRSHMTRLGDEDELVRKLPARIYDHMVAEMGETLTKNLLYTHWLEQIDTDLIRTGRVLSGGVTISECRKTQALVQEEGDVVHVFAASEQGPSQTARNVRRPVPELSPVVVDYITEGRK